MAALPPPREDRLRKLGIVPGMTIRIAYVAGESIEECVTLVEEVTAERIGVAVPIVKLRERPLPRGAALWANYGHRGRQWRFVTKVMGRSQDGSLEYLAAPADVESCDRRQFFRLPTALHPRSVYRLVLDGGPESASDERSPLIDCMVVDLSEGGCCLSTRDPSVQVGERLGIDLELPHVGQVLARMLVVGIEEPTRERRNRRIHCQFTEISLGNRDRIAKYLIRRQLEMRRRGQL